MRPVRPQVPLTRVLVVSDDLDSPTAAVRLKQRGGHGGHNGLRSIIDRMGGKSDFPRLKIGARRVEAGAQWPVQQVAACRAQASRMWRSAACCWPPEAWRPAPWHPRMRAHRHRAANRQLGRRELCASGL